MRARFDAAPARARRARPARCRSAARLGELAAPAPLDQPGGLGDVGFGERAVARTAPAARRRAASSARQREHDGQRLLLRRGGRSRSACRSPPGCPRCRAGRRRPGTRARARGRTPASASTTRCLRVGEQRADRRRAGEQRAGLGALHLDALVERRVDARLERHVGRLPGDHRVRRPRQRGGTARSRPASPTRASMRMASVWSASPAMIASPTPNSAHTVGRCRRSRSPSITSSCSSEKLWTSSTATAPRHAHRRARAGRLGGEDRERGPDALPAAALMSVALLVGPAQVVAHRPAAAAARAGGRRRAARARCTRGSLEHGGHGADHATTSTFPRARRRSDTGESAELRFGLGAGGDEAPRARRGRPAAHRAFHGRRATRWRSTRRRGTDRRTSCAPAGAAPRCPGDGAERRRGSRVTSESTTRRVPRRREQPAPARP